MSPYNCSVTSRKWGFGSVFRPPIGRASFDAEFLFPLESALYGSAAGLSSSISYPGTFVKPSMWSSIYRKLVDFNAASAGYFHTLQTPLLAGRDFGENDTPASPLVAIVNERFARTFFGDAKLIGETFVMKQSGGKPDKVYRIVGLVGDTKYRDLREDFNPIVFVAENQVSDHDPDSTFLIRSNESPSSLISSLKSTAARSSPEIVLNFSVFRTSVVEKLTREGLMATLSGFFGVLAAILAMVGIYGIISYMVVRRRSEIGVRIALGANKADILRLFLREAVALLAAGLVTGTALAIASGSAAQAMLFGLKPTDPPTLALAIGSLTIVAVAASILPAARAIAVDPMQVLREE